jgi:hypothetical protein
MIAMGSQSEPDVKPVGDDVKDDLERQSEKDGEPTVEGAFAADGVDLTLIRWMLEQSPTERLRAAQELIDAIWVARDRRET